MNGFFRYVLLVSCLLAGASCSLLPQRQESANEEALLNSSSRNIEPLLFYTEQIAEQLFYKLAPLEAGAIVVTTFGDVQTLAPNVSQHSRLNAALQLQESMQTVAAQLGYQVSEARLNRAVLVETTSELVLSRDLAELAHVPGARYVITGTLTEGPQALTVNAKLIELGSSQVKAAASGLIPVQAFGIAEQLQLRQNKLYRQSEF